MPFDRLSFEVGVNSETYEAAFSSFEFYKYQYTTEWLRRFSINSMDYANEYYVSLKTKPFKYTSLAFILSSSQNETSYDYKYKGKSYDRFHYAEFGLGMRFAFGESYFKLLHAKYPMKSKFPILWMQLNWGLDNVLGGDFDYFKADFRLEYKLRSFLLGRAMFQMNGGFASGDLPYFKLYEGYGADGAAVAHNRFETMVINEFISDRYFNFFITYELTKLYFRHYPKFRPTIEIDYNFGIGSLEHPEYHEEVSFNTLEHGYHEVGFSLKSIVAVNIMSVKMGLGFGNYFRVGYYKYDDLKDNYFGKFLLTFSL